MLTLRDYQLRAIEDVHRAWAAGFRRPCIVIPCGGGKSIITADMAKRTTEGGKRVLFLVHRRELCEQIEQTFTDYGVDMSLCEVGMVQTVCRHTDKHPTPTLIITDENHHCLAKSYRKIYDAYPDAWCVGVTATPVRLGGGGLGDVNDRLIIGPNVRELIERGCLADFDVYAPPVADLSGLRKKSTGDYDTTQAAEILGKPAIYGDIIEHYQRLAGGIQSICYCPTVAYSEEIAGRFAAAGIPAAHIDGETPKDKRAETIKAFRDGRVQVLCNVDLISEGFDVPDCGCAILLRPTKSLTLYTQQAMRPMRYKPGKRAIIIDHVGNALRHGLPDEPHTWTLDPKPARKKETTVTVRQCPECYFVHYTAPSCPECGHVYAKTREEIIEEKKQEALVKLERRMEHIDTADECRNVKELFALAKKLGHKPGWAWHQAKARGWLK